MENLLDYLDWRGDLDLDASPLNDVDFAILSALSYAPFEQVAVNNVTGLTLAELMERYRDDLQLPTPPSLPTAAFNRCVNDLFARAAQSARFSPVRLRRFVSSTEDHEVDELDKQFCAATFSFDSGEEGAAVVVFRGTDSTIVGWRENFTMGYEDTVPAQRDAAAYVYDELRRFRRLYLCGHSKGGNLAFYAAATAKYSDRIVRAISFDGPGLSDAVLATPEWAAVRDRTCTLVPQGSVVGMLLGAGEERHVITADGAGIAQHDLFQWHVRGTSFVPCDEMTTSSIIFDHGIDDFMASSTEEERKAFVYGLFKLLNPDGDISTTADLLPSLPKRLSSALWGGAKGKQSSFTDEELAALKNFWACIKHSGAEELGDNLADFVHPFRHDDEESEARVGFFDRLRGAIGDRDEAAEAAEAAEQTAGIEGGSHE